MQIILFQKTEDCIRQILTFASWLIIINKSVNLRLIGVLFEEEQKGKRNADHKRYENCNNC